jgi:hypothetical protein
MEEFNFKKKSEEYIKNFPDGQVLNLALDMLKEAYLKGATDLAEFLIDNNFMEEFKD